MIISVPVLAEDIATGKRGDGCACPVWLAVTRVLPNVPSVSIGPADVWYWDRGTGGPLGRSRLPFEARHAIWRLDRGESVEPFTFELDVPDELAAGLVSA